MSAVFLYTSYCNIMRVKSNTVLHFQVVHTRPRSPLLGVVCLVADCNLSCSAVVHQHYLLVRIRACNGKQWKSAGHTPTSVGRVGKGTMYSTHEDWPPSEATLGVCFAPFSGESQRWGTPHMSVYPIVFTYTHTVHVLYMWCVFLASLPLGKLMYCCVVYGQCQQFE